MPGPRWTTELDTILVTLARTCPDTKLSERLDRSPRAIEQRRLKLGLRRPRAWTPELNARLIALARTHTDAQLVPILGRTRSAISIQRFVALGIWEGNYKLVNVREP